MVILTHFVTLLLKLKEHTTVKVSNLFSIHTSTQNEAVIVSYEREINKTKIIIPKHTCIPPQLAGRLLLLHALFLSESQPQPNSKADLEGAVFKKPSFFGTPWYMSCFVIWRENYLLEKRLSHRT